jgi:hypothetical protein
MLGLKQYESSKLAVHELDISGSSEEEVDPVLQDS